MRKFLLVVLIGMAAAINLYGLAIDIYETYFVEIEEYVVPNAVEVTYIE